jgi:hypothetical protein
MPYWLKAADKVVLVTVLLVLNMLMKEMGEGSDVK